MKDETFYSIQGWMTNRLNLKGIEKEIYAIIYGFSQDGETEFKGSLSYLCEATSTSRPTVIKALASLVEKKYIVKRTEIINKVVFNRYKADLQVVNNLNRGSKEILLGGSKETLPNNISIDNIKENIIINNNIKENQKNTRFVKPKVDEVEDYIREKGYHIDAQYFIDYYESKGWMIGRNHMKDWKSAVRNWERMNKERQTQPTQQKPVNAFARDRTSDYETHDHYYDE